jgi:uncharacterized protein (TIGR02271 family)
MTSIDQDSSSKVPLVAEELRIDRTEAITDQVRVSTNVEERAVMVEGEVERGELDVQRIAVERAVVTAPEPRQEGNTLIVSIVEERLVVEKRLFVIEELHITRTTSVQQVAIPQTVRTMRATVERRATSTERQSNDG